MEWGGESGWKQTPSIGFLFDENSSGLLFVSQTREAFETLR